MHDLDVAEIYQQPCLEERVQRLDNFDQTHLVQAVKAVKASNTKSKDAPH